MPNEQLYGDTPKISTTITRRRLRHAGHIYPYEQPAKPLLLWTPSHGKRRSGRQNLDVVTLLEDDSGLTRRNWEWRWQTGARGAEWSLIRARPPDRAMMVMDFVRSFIRMRLQVSREDAERVYPVNEVAASKMHCVLPPVRCKTEHSRSTYCRVLGSLQCRQRAVLLRPYLNI